MVSDLETIKLKKGDKFVDIFQIHKANPLTVHFMLRETDLPDPRPTLMPKPTWQPESTGSEVADIDSTRSDASSLKSSEEEITLSPSPTVKKRLRIPKSKSEPCLKSKQYKRLSPASNSSSQEPTDERPCTSSLLSVGPRTAANPRALMKTSTTPINECKAPNNSVDVTAVTTSRRAVHPRPINL